MSTINYPAVFHQTEANEIGYWVEFPDLPGCFTQGDTLEEAYQYAQEALGLYLDNKDKESFNNPSSVKNLQQLFPNEIIMLVGYISLEYAKKYKTKSIKKTLSIPEWLNDEALANNINFSQVLQEALINKLESLKN